MLGLAFIFPSARVRLEPGELQFPDVADSVGCLLQ